MKRIIALLLVAVMCLSLAACGGGNEMPTEDTPIKETTDNDTPTEAVEDDTDLTIGDTVQGDLFELTLTGVEFSEELNGDSTNDNFLLPVTDGENVSTSLKTEDGEIYISFTFEYKFIGKTEQTVGTYFIPFVRYNDEYSFYKSYYTVQKSAVWEILDADTIPPLHLSSFSKTYKPLDATVYECRGFISVPKEVAEKVDNSLTIQLGDGTFTIR